MNVYDFDKTIYASDSTIDFLWFCLKRYPKLWKIMPRQVLRGAWFRLGGISKQRFKEGLFMAFLSRLEHPEQDVEQFWQENIHRIRPFYARTRQKDDVIISASPEFLILPACKKLGIRCAMASPVDAHTGKYQGANCHGEEKIRRFYARFPDGKIQDFYSDSHSDDPLAAIAQNAYLVRGNTLLPWKK